jgi:hypothetical protein
MEQLAQVGPINPVITSFLSDYCPPSTKRLLSRRMGWVRAEHLSESLLYSTRLQAVARQLAVVGLISAEYREDKAVELLSFITNYGRDACRGVHISFYRSEAETMSGLERVLQVGSFKAEGKLTETKI